jgi:hypothetical protein
MPFVVRHPPISTPRKTVDSELVVDCGRKDGKTRQTPKHHHDVVTTSRTKHLKRAKQHVIRINIRDPCSSRPRYRYVPSPFLSIIYLVLMRVGRKVVDLSNGRQKVRSQKNRQGISWAGALAKNGLVP